MNNIKMFYEIAQKPRKVLPRLELDSLGSESKVLTITPMNHLAIEGRSLCNFLDSFTPFFC